MFETIEGATDCEIRSVIRFLNARNVLPSEIHHQICHVYGDNAMNVGNFFYIFIFADDSLFMTEPSTLTCLHSHCGLLKSLASNPSQVV